MAEPKVLISKKSIKTMGKDMVRIKRDEVGSEEYEKDDKKTLLEEVRKRKQEEERLRSLQNQGEKIVQGVLKKSEEVEKQKETRLESEKQAKRLAILQEERKKAEQEDKKDVEKEKLVESSPKVENNKQAMSKEELLEKRKQVQLEKQKVQEELNSLVQNKEPLDVKKKAILEEIKIVEFNFQETKTKEEEVEQKLLIIEKKEFEAKDPQERRSAEEKRWKLEKKREEIEKKRWPEDEKLENLDARLKGMEKEGKDLEIKEQELLKRQKDINKKEQDISLKLERINLEQTLRDIEENSSMLEERVSVLFKNTEQAKNDLNIVSEEEKRVEQEKQEIEGREKNAENISQRRDLEKSRWQIEEKRRKVESKRWKLEEEKEKVSHDLKDSQGRLKTILNKKEDIIKRIGEIDLLLQGKMSESTPEPTLALSPQPALKPEVSEANLASVGSSGEARPASAESFGEVKEKTREEKLEEVEKERIAKIEEARKRIDTLKKVALERKERQEQIRKAVLPSMARQKLESKPQKLEPGKEERRSEIMKRLITPVSIYNKINNVKEKEPVKEQSKVPELEEIIRVVPKKPGFREKLWIRALVVAATLIILAGILTFWYWYFRIRTSGPIYPPGYEKEKAGIDIPSALFDISDIVIITISNPNDLSESLRKTLQSVQPINQFKRIIIKKDGEIIGVKEFFEMVQVEVPDNFYDSIIDEPTMFIYSQGQGNRFGFVVKTSVSAQSFNIILKSMEPTAETDFEELFVLMGKEGKAVAPFFKDAKDVQDYDGLNFRFKTLNQNDLGILYIATDYYFAFSSSWESMESLLINIQLSLENKLLTVDLKTADQSSQVLLLQKWLTKEFNIQNPNFVSGNFDLETKNYVIKFQEKYSNDILIPQGLIRGTGIVDLTTRKKLNELYSEFKR